MSSVQFLGLDLAKARKASSSESKLITQLCACVPKTGNTIAAAGEHIGRRGAAGNVARARNGQAAIGTLGAAQAKLRHGATVGGEHHARRLGGDKRLEADDVEQRRLEQLALRARDR